MRDYIGVLKHASKFIRLVKDDVVYGDEDKSDSDEEPDQKDRTFYGITDSQFLKDLEPDTDVQVINFCLFSEDIQIASRFCSGNKIEEMKYESSSSQVRDEFHEKEGSCRCLIKATLPQGCINAGIYVDSEYRRFGEISTITNSYALIAPYSFFRIKEVTEVPCKKIPGHSHTTYHVVLCKDNLQYVKYYPIDESFSSTNASNMSISKKNMNVMDDLFKVDSLSSSSNSDE